MSWAGQEHSAEIYVEGLPTTNPSATGESRTLGLGISVEAVDQFQLESAGTSVMYQGQGSSNYVLKSGTNSFRGAAYEYFRNTALDARGFFAPVTPTEHQNEFGFSIGGPIKKNKLFFFANYDGYRFTQVTQSTYMTLPTAAQRNGDFSALLPSIRIYDPASTVCNAAGVCSRTAFPGNIIPANRISPISQSFQSYLPAATNNALQLNYLRASPVGYHDNSTTDKVDYTLNEKNTFSFFSAIGTEARPRLIAATFCLFLTAIRAWLTSIPRQLLPNGPMSPRPMSSTKSAMACHASMFRKPAPRLPVIIRKRPV